MPNNIYLKSNWMCIYILARVWINLSKNVVHECIPKIDKTSLRNKSCVNLQMSFSEILHSNIVHVHATAFFAKVHPVCHNIANRMKPRSDSKKTYLWCLL